MKKIIVAVGSTRRPKLDAVTEALVSIQSAFAVDKAAPEMEFEVVGFEVPSGVRHTPLSREDLMTGARQRAEALVQIARAENKPWKYFVGLEGGIDVIVVDAEPAVAIELSRSLHALPDPPPVVLVSSSPSAPEISAHIGAAAFLPKPFDVAELVAIIARHVEPRPVRMFAEFGDDEATDLVGDV